MPNKPYVVSSLSMWMIFNLLILSAPALAQTTPVLPQDKPGDLHQWGNGNRYGFILDGPEISPQLKQVGDANYATASIRGAGHRLTIKQNGTRNVVQPAEGPESGAGVRVDSAGPVSVFIRQAGQDNRAATSVLEGSAVIDIGQNGGNNNASAKLSHSVDDTVTIRQGDVDNGTSVWESHAAVVIENSNGNRVFLSQAEGSGNHEAVTISGGGANSVDLFQQNGSGNKSTAWAVDAHRNAVGVTQSGDRNDFSLSLLQSSDNAIYGESKGTANRVVLSFTGSDHNHFLFFQDGQRNLLDVAYQDSDSNQALTASQAGNDNSGWIRLVGTAVP